MEEENLDIIIDLSVDQANAEIADEEGLFHEMLDQFNLQEGRTVYDIQPEDCFFQMIGYNITYEDEPYKDHQLYWMPKTHPVALALYCLSAKDPEQEIGNRNIGQAVLYRGTDVNIGIQEMLSFFKRYAGQKNEEDAGDEDWPSLNPDAAV